MPWSWGGWGRQNYQENMAPPNEPINNLNRPSNQIDTRTGEPYPGEQGGRGIRPGGMPDDTPDLIPPGSQPLPFVNNPGGFRWNGPIGLLVLILLVVLLVVVIMELI
jgi:hypothetical protein